MGNYIEDKGMVEIYKKKYEELKDDFNLIEEEAPLYASQTRFRYVYMWQVNNYVYIGQSFNPIKRWIDEIKESYGKKYKRQQVLYNLFKCDYNKFLKEATFKILAVTDKENINILEHFYIDHYKTFGYYELLNKEGYVKNDI